MKTKNDPIPEVCPTTLYILDPRRVAIRAAFAFKWSEKGYGYKTIGQSMGVSSVRAGQIINKMRDKYYRGHERGWVYSEDDDSYVHKTNCSCGWEGVIFSDSGEELYKEFERHVKRVRIDEALAEKRAIEEYKMFIAADTSITKDTRKRLIEALTVIQ